MSHLDLTVEQRHKTRLEARKVFEADPSTSSMRVYFNEGALDAWQDFADRLTAPMRARVVDFRVVRCICPVHPRYVAILHADEDPETMPCPLCWAAAGVELSP
jgi:hypothetical protein